METLARLLARWVYMLQSTAADSPRSESARFSAVVGKALLGRSAMRVDFTIRRGANLAILY